MGSTSERSSDVQTPGYRRGGYAEIKLCRDYVEMYEGDYCVHCKWFEMMEPATVYLTAARGKHKKEAAVAGISGDCVRFPPKLFMIAGSMESEFPGVSGANRCGEFREQRRSAEEICFFEKANEVD